MVGNLPALLRPGPNRRGMLDKGIRGNEGIILLSQLLDKLLVLVKLLEVISRHAGNVVLLSFINVHLVTKDTDLHVGLRDVLQLHSATETLVLLGVIVLEADLELDRLAEVALLVLGALEDAINALVQG